MFNVLTLDFHIFICFDFGNQPPCLVVKKLKGLKQQRNKVIKTVL